MSLSQGFYNPQIKPPVWAGPEVMAVSVQRRCDKLGLYPPVGYWPLGDYQGYDLGGYGNTGILTNGPTIVPGPDGLMTDFDGNNDYIDCGNNPSVQITGAFTIFCAFITDDATENDNKGLLAKWIGSGNKRCYVLYIEYQVDNNPRLAVSVSINGSSIISARGNTTLAVNTLYYGAAVYVPSTSLTVYLNGVQDGVNTTSIPASIYNGATNLLIGAHYYLDSPGMYLLDGKIGGTSIFPKALNSSQIGTLFEHRHGLLYPEAPPVYFFMGAGAPPAGTWPHNPLGWPLDGPLGGPL